MKQNNGNFLRLLSGKRDDMCLLERVRINTKYTGDHFEPLNFLNCQALHNKKTD